MDKNMAFLFICDLADGINPFTEEKITDCELINKPEIKEALKLAKNALSFEINKIKSQWTPDNSGAGWDNSESSRLYYSYESGTPINILAIMHQRSENSIRARLKHLGIHPNNIYESLNKYIYEPNLDFDDDDLDDLDDE